MIKSSSFSGYQSLSKISIYLLVVLVTGIDANTKTWLGGVGLWSGNNWGPVASPPTIGDDVVVSGNNSFVISYSTVIVNSLTIGNKLAPNNATVALYNSTSISNITVNSDNRFTINNMDLYAANSFDVYGVVNINYTAVHNTINAQLDSTVYIFGPAYLENIIGTGTLYIYETVLYLYQATLFEGYLFTKSGSFLIMEVGTQTSTFRDLLAVIPATKFVLSHNVIFDSSTISINDSYTSFNSSSFQFKNVGMFYNIEETSRSLVTIDNSIFNATQDSSFFFEYTVVKVNTSQIMVNDSYMAIMNSVSSLVNSDIIIQGTSLFHIKEGSLDIKEGSLLVTGEGQLSAEYSSVLSIEGTKGGFLSIGNSSVFVTNSSIIYISGYFVAGGGSHVYSITDSTICVNGTLLATEDSVFGAYDNSTAVIVGNLAFINQTRCEIVDSQLLVDGNVSFSGNSSLWVTFSDFIVPGEVSVSSNLKFEQSTATIVGDVFSSGMTGIYDSQIHILGTFISIGVSHFERTVLLSLSGSSIFKNEFKGNNTVIGVQGGNLNVMENSTFECYTCAILIYQGDFLYAQNSVVTLFNTSLYNEGGHLTSQSNMVVFPGSSISNAGTFTLSNNIQIPSINHPLMSTATAMGLNELAPVEFTNSGSLKSTADVSIEIPVTNSGSFDVQNTSITLQQYTQTNGTLTVQGGSISSPQTISIQSGTLQGNGTINGSISNSGNLGSSNSNIDVLTVNGSLTQSQNATIYIIIQSLNNFSQFNISNNLIFDGTIEIRISNNLTKQQNGPIEIPVIHYAQSSGDFKSAKLVVYDPNTGEQDTSQTCDMSSQKGGSKYSVLVSDCRSQGSSKSMTKIAIGVVVGVVAASIIVGGLIHYRKRISLHLRYRTERVSISLTHFKERTIG